MWMVIKIALVLVVLGVLLLASLIAWLLRVVRRGLKDEAALPLLPCRVSLESEPSPQWRNPNKINEYAGPFQIGFRGADRRSNCEVDLMLHFFSGGGGWPTSNEFSFMLASNSSNSLRRGSSVLRTECWFNQ